MSAEKPSSRSTLYRKRKAEAELTSSGEESSESHVSKVEEISDSDSSSASSTSPQNDLQRDGNEDENTAQNINVGAGDIDQESHKDEDEENLGHGSMLIDSDQHSEPNQDDDNDSSSESDIESSDLSSESEDEINIPLVGETPLYDGGPITLAQSLIAILTFSCLNNLSGSTLTHLLALISLHIPSTPDVFKSLYRFKKYFSALRTPLHCHFYCTKCMKGLPTENSACGNCPAGTNKMYFITLSIVDQLKNMYKRKGFSLLLKKRFQRQKKHNSNYEDIYDGAIYKKYVNEGFLGGSNISFTWDSGGVSIFKSSKYEIWPFYIVINELPYNERFKEENLVLAGLWFGEKKPDANLFMSRMTDDFKEVFDGIEVFSPDDPELKNVRGVVICGTCDLPARAKFLNMTQFNGYFSCSKCLIKGERSERTENHFAFPVDNSPLRKEKDMKLCADEALRKGEAVQGMKGPTVLSRIVPHCYRSTAVDVMHCVYQGVAKRLMQLWFEPEFRNEPFTLRVGLNTVSDFVASITPPSYIKRLPRSIVEHMSYWKASEFKAWLLYYSIPIIKELMSDEYFNRYLLLVSAIYLLNQDSVSENDIETASVLLRQFVNHFQILYGFKGV